ncbi:hypothetical protein LXL04_003898 [Taraxacum kok-saghyz]
MLRNTHWRKKDGSRDYTAKRLGRWSTAAGLEVLSIDRILKSTIISSKLNLSMANASILLASMGQVISEQKIIFELGDEVEVNGRTGDVETCFYAGIITKDETDKAQLKYYSLKKVDGKPLVESVDLKNLRPKPIDFRFKFKWGDFVDIWIKNRWCVLCRALCERRWKEKSSMYTIHI